MKRAVGKDRLGNRRTLRAGPPNLIKTYSVKRKKNKTKKEIVGKSNKYKPLNYDKRLHYDFIPR